MAAYRQLEGGQNARDFAAALDFLRAHPAVDGTKLAATGYCFGSGVIWRLATIYPQLAAAAPFYGGAPPMGDVPNIRAAVLGVYAGNDERLNASIPGLEAALVSAGVRYRINVYPGANHGFHGDAGANYHPEAATHAWTDTLAWFGEHLGLVTPTA